VDIVAAKQYICRKVVTLNCLNLQFVADLYVKQLKLP